jgi:hypothetical protein
MKIGTHQDGIDLPGLLLMVGNDAAHEIGIRVSKQIQKISKLKNCSFKNL